MSKRFQIIGRKLIITLSVNPPKRSKSGKSLLIASTRGPRNSGITINGKEVRVSANAFILVDRKPLKPRAY
jgi:hypothetical protein